MEHKMLVPPPSSKLLYLHILAQLTPATEYNEDETTVRCPDFHDGYNEIRNLEPFMTNCSQMKKRGIIISVQNILIGFNVYNIRSSELIADTKKRGGYLMQKKLPTTTCSRSIAKLLETVDLISY